MWVCVLTSHSTPISSNPPDLNTHWAGESFKDEHVSSIYHHIQSIYQIFAIRVEIFTLFTLKSNRVTYLLGVSGISSPKSVTLNYVTDCLTLVLYFKFDK